MIELDYCKTQFTRRFVYQKNEINWQHNNIKIYAKKKYHRLLEVAQQDAEEIKVNKKHSSSTKKLLLYMYSIVSHQILVLINHPLH